MRLPKAKATPAALEALVSGPISEDVVTIPEHPTHPFDADVTELVSWIHPVSTLDEAKKDKISFGFKQFKQAIIDSHEIDGGLCAGWGEIEFEHNRRKMPPFHRFYRLEERRRPPRMQIHTRVHGELPLVDGE